MRRSVWVLTLALLGLGSPAAAQTFQFFPRYDFHLAAEHLSGDDPRFVWDADFGGSLDLIDYGIGRFTFATNYEVIMGEQLRIFDPNQGNYILEGATSARLAGFEVAGVFYHQSRHLSDRIKVTPVDWNMMGGRLRRAVTTARAAWDAQVDLRRTVQSSYVDYTWEMEAQTHARIPLRSRVALVSAGDVRVLGVDGSRDRGTQVGYLAEGGLRLEGNAGAVELFVNVERRVDPYQLQFGTLTWAATGFRLLSR